ncbi:universal stress protein [Pseudenhygromyxa sp. WMMC2535]|uniref:universal stress protein n=1 Tax=Pseudenhygromyxa sp. WMMC2535 TaxID=2712867 RepID=UPI001551A412|nr:universal stress protein [Pseudenhygromyxa sp. WMMC2535]NVB36473.1 universal stress protein [Pseudenhygromyxa sp. WMMC2535]
MSGTEVRANKWGVGVELAEDHLGPIRFLAAISGREDDLRLGLHVLPDQQMLHPLVNPEDAKAIRKKVEKNVAETLARGGLEGAQTRVELIEDDEIERGLCEGGERLGLDALVIGRRARRDEDPIVRLGEVARRVLRRLPAPVVVVPPDFGSPGDAGLGKGPILLATDLSEHCDAAASFAADLAARLERPLILAHGTQAFHWGVSYIPAEAMARLQDQARSGADQKLVSWAKGRGLEGAKHEVFMGDPVKHLLRIADSEDAAVLVTGSRKLGAVERLFLASVSSELAAAASCPVAVVG